MTITTFKLTVAMSEEYLVIITGMPSRKAVIVGLNTARALPSSVKEALRQRIKEDKENAAEILDENSSGFFRPSFWREEAPVFTPYTVSQAIERGASILGVPHKEINASSIRQIAIPAEQMSRGVDAIKEIISAAVTFPDHGAEIQGDKRGLLAKMKKWFGNRRNLSNGHQTVRPKVTRRFARSARQ